MVYLMDTQLLSSDRTGVVLREVFGCEVSEGTLYNAREKCFEQLAPVEQQIKARIETVDGVHCPGGHRQSRRPEWVECLATHQLRASNTKPYSQKALRQIYRRPLMPTPRKTRASETEPAETLTRPTRLT